MSRELIRTTIQRFNEVEDYADRYGQGKPVSVTTKANIKKLCDRLRINQAHSVHNMAIFERSMSRIVKKVYKQGKEQLLSDANKMKRKERSKGRNK